jgi:hypothetical protein
MSTARLLSQGQCRALLGVHSASAPAPCAQNDAPPITLPPLDLSQHPRWVRDAHSDTSEMSLDFVDAPGWADLFLENLDLDLFDDEGYLLAARKEVRS